MVRLYPYIHRPMRLLSFLGALLFALCFRPVVQAQDLSISELEMPDSVLMNGTATASFLVTNQTTENQLGNLRIWFLNASNDSIQAPLGNFEVLQLLAPGQTRRLEVTIPIEPQYFIEGGNTVVIWPSFVGQEIVPDSLSKDIYVRNPSATPKHALIEQQYLIQNPVYTILSIQAVGNAVPPQRIIVRDLTGKACVVAESVSSVNVSHLPAGIYIVEFQLPDGLRHVRRIVKGER